MEEALQAEMNNNSTNASSNFQRVVRLTMVVKRWIKFNRVRKGRKEGTADDENVRRVFENVQHAATTEIKEKWQRKILNWSLSDSSLTFYLWTALVFIGCFYNLITIVAMVFEEIRHSFYESWLMLNKVFDVVFLLDLFILTRKEFIEDGIQVNDAKRMLVDRVKSKFFYVDLLCILPTDFLLSSKLDIPLCRLNRLLKCYRIVEFDALTEIRTSFPNLFRIVKLIFLCFIIFHWNGCLYFYISVVYDFPNAVIDDWIFSYDKIPDPVLVHCSTSDDWNTTEWNTAEEECRTDIVPPLRIFEEYKNMTQEIDIAMMYWMNRTRTITFTNLFKQYTLSFYWSALTLVTLGEQPSPKDTFQNSFEILDTLIGLVLFAVIVGDVGNMVTNMNMKRSNFEEVLDGCKGYMIYRKVQSFLQRKALEYFAYTWSHGGGQMDEEEIAEFLPSRLYGQLAVHIHMETLRRVKLFEDCEPNLLYELILKLELRIYSPLDYVCRKGDVGTEMYIVKAGSVEVVSDDGTKVFVQLGAGTVFGELSILNIPGNKNGNRRTANVRSVGYSDLYVLSKEDLWEALREYPEAKNSLLMKGKSILAKDNMLEDVAEEEELDPDAPVDEQLHVISNTIHEIERLLDEAERKFRESSTRMKQKLFRVERDVDKELKMVWKSSSLSCHQEVRPITR
uniref:Cyclic nucleotide-binding domain-containing protein n=1 Tax=Haemonchus contortus TaxID=6289 RepID=A0A912M2H8_HAECO